MCDEEFDSYFLSRDEADLHRAAKAGDATLVASLLANDSSIVNVTDKDNKRAIHYAAENGHAEVVKQLLKYNSTLRGSLSSPGHLAAQNGHLHVLALLLDHDPQLADSTDVYNLTLLKYAVKGGQNEVVSQLLASKPSLLEDKTLLHFAVRSGHAKTVALLLTCRPQLADPTERPRTTALHTAAECGNAEIVAQLLAHRSSLLDERDIEGRTALHLAAAAGHEAVVACLLAGTPDVYSVENLSGYTALHCAASHGRENVVAQLLAHTPSLIDCVDYGGANALLSAGFFGRERVVEMLFATKPELSRVCEDSGATLLHYVMSTNDRRQPFNSALVEKVWHMHPEALHTGDQTGKSPFFIAVLKKNQAAIDFFQWKSTIGELVRGFSRDTSIDPEAIIRPLVEQECASLLLVLNRDVCSTIYEYLGFDCGARARKRAKRNITD